MTYRKRNPYSKDAGRYRLVSFPFGGNMELNVIVEIVVVMASVVSLVWAGVFIGRECGTFESFVRDLLKNLEKKLN